MTEAPLATWSVSVLATARPTSAALAKTGERGDDDCDVDAAQPAVVK